MKQFTYYRPKNKVEAVELLANLPEVKILAGGTDLVIQLREGAVAPANVVDISSLTELKEIKVTDREVIIGSMVTFTEALEHPVIANELSCLAQACAMVGSPQIRNQGTIGGNIVNASPAADSVPGLVALGAKAIIESKGNIEEKNVQEILVGVGQNNLAKGQLVTYLKIPRLIGEHAGAFAKLARRNALAIARMSMAAVLTMDSKGQILTSGISLGAVAPNPFRVVSAEEYLQGKEMNKEILANVVKIIGQTVKEKLGNRASAVYKNEAITGVANQTFTKILAQLKGGRHK